MSPQHRPFFSNFLAAFRAHGPSAAFQKTVSSPATVTPLASAVTSFSTTAQPQSTAESSSSSATAVARPIAAKINATTNTTRDTTAGATANLAIQTASGTFQPTRHHTPSPYSRSPVNSSPLGSAFSTSPSPSPASTSFGGSSGRRRGSDSSNDGWRDIVGQEKWYIGGRTGAGEERFYQLGMVRRPRSLDRLSCDRMSL